MNNGICYVFNSDNTISAFPDIVCSDNSILEFDESTRVEDYQVYGGRLFKIRERSALSSDFEYGSITHIWSDSNYFIDMNFGLLSATLLLIGFFIILFRWFIRLRG